jgi:hypothetical protein
MSPTQKDKMTIAHLLFSTYGIPVLVFLASCNLWYIREIYTEYKVFKVNTQQQLLEHETRIIVVETKLSDK